MKATIRSVALLATIFVFLLSSQAGFALSAEQKKVIQSGSYYYNVDKTPPGCGSSTVLTGADAAEQAWNFFISKGMTPIQAAGSFGNLKHEAGFNPKRVEGGHMEGDRWVNQNPLQFPAEMDTMPPNVGPAGQPGYGIVQWTSPGRKDGLVAFAASKNLPVYDYAMQLEYMWSELTNETYKPRALDPLLATNDLSEAVRIWQEKYEGGANFEPRLAFAQDALTTYGSGTPVSSGSTTCGGGSGQVTGGYSLPTDRQFYDENTDWFTKTHHDNPAADIPVPEGTSIYAIRGGVVSISDGACGVGITIAGDDGASYNYCHGSDGGSVPGALPGDTVEAGQLIMHSSYTGHVIPAGPGGSHLHVGIYIGGTAYCPQTLFVGIASGTVPNIADLPKTGCTYKS